MSLFVFIKMPEIFNYRKVYWGVSGIYCIKSKTNGKIYVGSSINIYRRISDHLYKLRKNKHYNSHLQRSFLKYGEEDFYTKVLENCPIENLTEREQFFMDMFESYNNVVGYNIDPTANHSVLSKETKIKISKIQKGRVSNRLGAKLNDSTKEKLRLANLGKHPSYETRKKISASLKGKNTWTVGVLTGPMSPSVKKKISLKNKGSGNGMAKVVIFIKDGIIKGRWGSATEAAEFNKMKDYTIRRYIKKHRLYNGGYFEFE